MIKILRLVKAFKHVDMLLKYGHNSINKKFTKKKKKNSIFNAFPRLWFLVALVHFLFDVFFFFFFRYAFIQKRNLFYTPSNSNKSDKKIIKDYLRSY